MKRSSKKPGFKASVIGRSKHFVRQLNYTGLLFGLIFYCFSMLPSLLPRPWLYQGLISGVSIAIGYGLGVLTSTVIRWLVEKDVPVHVKRWAWRALTLIGSVLFVIFLVLGYIWQREVAKLVGEQPPSSAHIIRIVILTLIVALLLRGLARLIRKFNRFVYTQLDRVLPQRVSIALGVILVGALLWWIASGVLFDGFVTVANNIYRTSNATTPPGVSQPQLPTRSGSPESYVQWKTLGKQGQSFVSRGPTQQQLRDFNQTDPEQQIRVYVGLDSATTAAARAQLAVKELQRTHAFDRKVLILATATGTGWLEPQSVDSLEYMYDGDSAIVSQQYSYLPSWISFLTDTETAKEAGQALYDAVHTEWVKLPADHRPKLVAYGLSLGSFGGQSAYTSATDLKDSVDGALFMGTPSETTLWRSITDNRDKGSPEWQPVYQDGTTVRFAATNANITTNQSAWAAPRILYMQHASDPVVWFSFSLALHEPDWLKEPRGYDVSPRTRWFPFVTFWQVAVDQFFGVTVPNGHGHNYGNTIVNAWGAVTPPTDWNNDKAAALQKIIDAYPNE